MSWPPELEIIDQLQGGPMAPGTLRRVFSNDEHALRVLGVYLSRGVMVFLRDGEPLPEWEAKELLRDDQNFLSRTDILLSLTDAGANAFEKGGWDQFR